VTTSNLYGTLAIASFALVWVFGTLAFLFTVRLRTRPSVDAIDEPGSVPTVVRKIRRGESLSDDEMALARHTLAARGHLMAFAIPATLFCLGCFYVFGSLEQLHGHQASERTFLGVIPMITSTNLGIQVLRSVILKRRLPKPKPARRTVASE
jgi:hypothetical protein